MIDLSIERIVAEMSDPCLVCDGMGAVWDESVEDDGYHGWWAVCRACDGTGKEEG